MATPRTAAAESAGADQILRLVRTFAAPRAAVFRAWTDPQQLVQWWGPEGYTVPVCDMDPRESGAWRTCMLSPEGTQHWVSGIYREIAEPDRLVFTWAWDDDNGERGHETVITIELRDKDGGTELTLTQQPFESVESRDAHNQGWTSSFNCLEAHTSGRTQHG